MLAIALAVLLWHGPAAAATTTPLVPNDVGHWLNLEHRTGKLAPQIAGNRHLVQAILVVERSLAKVDAYLTETRRTSGCHQLLLPYARIIREPVSEIDEEGNILLTHRKVRQEAWFPVGVCSSIDQRLVYWESDGEASPAPSTPCSRYRPKSAPDGRFAASAWQLAARSRNHPRSRRCTCPREYNRSFAPTTR
jgi:hypothetical protein